MKNTLLLNLSREMQEADFYWQVLAVLLALALAALINRQFGRKKAANGSADGLASGEGALQTALYLGQQGFHRVLFPLLAALMILIVRSFLKEYGHVNLLNLAITLLMSLAAVRMVVFILRQSFSNQQWLARSERIVAGLIWGGMALYLTGLSSEIVEALESVTFSVGKQSLNLWLILHGVVTVAVTVLIALWGVGLLEARLLATGMDTSLRTVLVRLSRAVFTLLAVLTALSMVGIDVTALSVFGGALGVGLGMGLQKIASNYVAGFIILLDRSIRLGNIIAVDANTSGQVTQITTRYTVLRHASGTEYIVPNDFLVANVVQNQSFSDTRVRLALPVQVAYDTDLELALQVLESAAMTCERVLPDPCPKAVVIAFADSGINLELGFWINDPEQGTATARSDVALAVWKALTQAGIRLPYPHRELIVHAASASHSSPSLG